MLLDSLIQPAIDLDPLIYVVMAILPLAVLPEVQGVLALATFDPK